MNMNFGKHFASMYEGSLIGAGAVVFAVMGYVISNQRPEVGEHGERLVVTLNPKLLGLIIGDGEKAVEEAIEYLCGNDKKSHRKEEEGKRLVRLDEFDYWVVNGRYYRELGREERRKEQNREAARRFRKNKKSQEQLNAEARERRFSKAVAEGYEQAADQIAAEALPGEGGA